MSTVAEIAGEAAAPPAEVVDIPDDEPVEYKKIQFNGKSTFADKAYETAVLAIESRQGNWRRVNIKLLDARTMRFQLSCSMCQQDFSCLNVSRFWGGHAKVCLFDDKTFGQVLLRHAGTFQTSESQ